MQDDDPAPVKLKRKKSDLFFAVDVRSAASAVAQGINPGIALLVLAAGTGGDQATTSWSVHAIETHTSMSRGRAGKAINYLIDQRLVQQTAKGSRPSYRIRPWAEVLEHHVGNLPIATQRAFRAIAGGRPVAAKDQSGQSHLERLGWTKNGVLTFWHEREPQYAWLPMAFVTGAGAEFAPPLERLRQTQDPMAFRLAVDLYHAQQMAEHAGVPVSILHRKHERKNVGTFGRFIVWAFSVESNLMATAAARPIAEQLGTAPAGETREQWQARVDDLFGRINLLVDCGILEFVSHLRESEHVDAQIIHPIAWGRSNGIEDQFGRVAHKAAMVTFERHAFTWHDEARKSAFRFVPGDRTVRGMQLVDIARMKYRANTKPNQAWWGQYQERSKELLAMYQVIVEGRQMEEVAVSPSTT
jgi:hypothetical protein